MEKLTIIGFGNKARSGKDTCADYLVTLGYKKLSFASVLYDIATYIQKTLNIECKKDPKLLQLIGDAMKKVYSDDVFSDVIKYKLLSEPGKYVLSDIRYYSEFNMLKKLGTTLVRVNRPDRIIDRDPTHASEIELDDAPWDYTIDNVGSIEDLYRKVDEIID